MGRLSAALALPEERRIELAQVPLQQLPPWLGVDRALVGWRAWRRQTQAVLVADAGTCLSLTCVDGQGRFRGAAERRVGAAAAQSWPGHSTAAAAAGSGSGSVSFRLAG